MRESGIILYIGGFVLPDKNAAAQRVVGIAKALRELGYNVFFLNSLKTGAECRSSWKKYFGFDCLEYQRESSFDYLVTAHTVISKIMEINPSIIFAYNYPAFSLNRIRKYCKKSKIRCYADATEWYQAFGSNPIFRIIKNVDTEFRMKIVHKKLDGVMAISRCLYEYYKNSVNTVLIPPVVDLSEEKWNKSVKSDNKVVNFVYAGLPTAQKEELDVIISAIERMPNDHQVILNVVGISQEQFVQIYGWKHSFSDRIRFYGRIEHQKVIEIVKKSNWSIILRENNQVVRAGFPTKLVESISCKTPVIANDFSNIKDYLNSENSIIIKDISEINEVLVQATSIRKKVDCSIFDFHTYKRELLQLIENK